MKITTNKRVQYILAIIFHILAIRIMYAQGQLPLKENGELLSIFVQIPFYFVISSALIFFTFFTNTEYAYRDMTKNSTKPINRETFLKLWTIILTILTIIMAIYYINRV